MWYKQSFFKYTTAIISVLLIIYLLYNVGFLFTPIIDFFLTLTYPVLLAGILYYVFRPLVRLQEKVRIPRALAIVNVYIYVLFMIVLLSIFVSPIISEQISAFTEAPTEKLEVVKEKTVNIMNFLNFNLYTIEELQTMLTAFLHKVYTFISDNIVSTLTNVTKLAIILVITPFLLFYLLKDDYIFYSHVIKLVPEKYEKDAQMLLEDADITLSTFITGQLLVAFIVGIIILIGYLIIGLNNAVILALFAMIFITIPFLGSFIAIIPALLIGLTESPFMALKVALVVLVAHLLEANLISPQVMSKRLHIHPLIIMLVLLASGFLYGIVGLFLATPAYALFKVIAIDIYKIWQSHAEQNKKVIQEYV
jgi:predicted PurR-regulated permease PerM